MKKGRSNIMGGEYLNTDGMAEEFNIPKSTQAKYRKEFGMPYKKIGGVIYYKIQEIKDWIDSHSMGGAPKQDTARVGA